jgi:hypothetical protein
MTPDERKRIHTALLRIYRWCADGKQAWAVRADKAELTDPYTASCMRRISNHYGQMYTRLTYFETEVMGEYVDALDAHIRKELSEK